MNLELHTLESLQTEQQIQYTFMVDAELASVGGGTAVVDY